MPHGALSRRSLFEGAFMAISNTMDGMFHRVRAKLYPNYLSGVEGAYIARTDDEASLNIEQVCSELKNRGGFTGSYDDLVGHVKQFFDEAAYQLCDGFSINTGYFSLHPKIGGTFNTAGETVDAKTHPVSFAFRIRTPLRDLTKHIEILVEGIADTSGYIGQIQDMDSETIDQELTPGGNAVIWGDKIKVEGDDDSVGAFFVNTADGNRVKVEKHFAENRSGKVIVVVPSDIVAGTYRLEIVTQFSHSSILLKEPRTIIFKVDLTVA
jgi:hypothetical protein